LLLQLLKPILDHTLMTDSRLSGQPKANANAAFPNIMNIYMPHLGVL